MDAKQFFPLWRPFLKICGLWEKFSLNRAILQEGWCLTDPGVRTELVVESRVFFHNGGLDINLSKVEWLVCGECEIHL